MVSIGNLDLKDIVFPFKVYQVFKTLDRCGTVHGPPVCKMRLRCKDDKRGTSRTYKQLNLAVIFLSHAIFLFLLNRLFLVEDFDQCSYHEYFQNAFHRESLSPYFRELLCLTR